jgi:D-proline reductase (dithiol) PrdB
MMRGVAELSELALSARIFMKAYRWRRVHPVPFASLQRPLHEAKVAIVSTAGLVLPHQQAFDDSIKGGDWSYREIPSDANVRSLRDTHRSGSYDHAGVQADPNLGLPLDRLRELATEGSIRSLNHRHFSMMGSITAPGRLVRESAPAVASALVEDAVDAVLLIPI